MDGAWRRTHFILLESANSPDPDPGPVEIGAPRAGWLWISGVPLKRGKIRDRLRRRCRGLGDCRENYLCVVRPTLMLLKLHPWNALPTPFG